MSVPEIEAVLRGDVPEPDPVFGHELDRRVAEGFPRKRRRLWRPPLKPALAAAVAATAAAVIGVVTLGGTSEQATVRPETGEVGTGLATQALHGSAAAPRKVERSINMT